MKITRSFTLDVGIALKLKKQKNQSQFVEDAIKLKLWKDEKENVEAHEWRHCNPCDVSYKVKKGDVYVWCRKCNAKLDALTVR